MVDLLKRLWRVCRAQLSSWLDLAEDPAKKLNLSIHELDDQYKTAREAVVHALATQKRLERSVKNATDQANRMRQEAHRAVKCSDAAAAKRYLGQCQKYLLVADSERNRLATVAGEVETLQSSLQQLEDRIELAGQRRVELSGHLQIGEAKMAIADATEHAAILENRGLGSAEAELAELAEKLNCEGEARMELAGSSMELDSIARQLALADQQFGAPPKGSEVKD